MREDHVFVKGDKYVVFEGPCESPVGFHNGDVVTVERHAPSGFHLFASENGTMAYLCAERVVPYVEPEPTLDALNRDVLLSLLEMQSRRKDASDAEEAYAEAVIAFQERRAELDADLRESFEAAKE